MSLYSEEIEHARLKLNRVTIGATRKRALVTYRKKLISFHSRECTRYLIFLSKQLIILREINDTNKNYILKSARDFYAIHKIDLRIEI